MWLYRLIHRIRCFLMKGFHHFYQCLFRILIRRQEKRRIHATIKCPRSGKSQRHWILYSCELLSIIFPKAQGPFIGLPYIESNMGPGIHTAIPTNSLSELLLKVSDQFYDCIRWRYGNGASDNSIDLMMRRIALQK